MQGKGNYYQTEPQKSKYNEAVSQILRIGSLWDSCHFFRKKGNLTQWNVNLDCIWLELSSDAESDDEDKLNELNKKFLEHKSRKDYQYQILMKKEMLLRKLQKKQGKGPAYLDPDEDDM